MQGYNSYYQSPASMQASSSSGQSYMVEPSSMSAKYTYAASAQPLDHLDYANSSPSRPFQHIQRTPSQTPPASSSGSSVRTLGLSPTSYRSSVSSMTQTPITPLDLNSPLAYKDGQSQDSWFAAMQDSYLLNKAQSNQQRPSLQRMQRMSQQAGSQFLSVGAQPPRRASVATFQPTTASQTSPSPARPSLQPAPNSDPILRDHRSSSYQAQPSSHLRSEAPRQQYPQQSTPIYEQGNNVDRLYAEVFGGQPIQPMYHHHPLPPQQSSASQSLQSPLPRFTAPAIYSPVGQYQPQQQQCQPASSDNYNFAGVLLQPEDLHMLGPDPLSPIATASASSYMQPSYSAQNPGWQTSFSLSVPPPPSQHQPMPVASSPARLQPALPIGGHSANWNFASFHGFAPIVTPAVEAVDPFERSLSAPPIDEDHFMVPEAMDRRRGSSVDSVAMVPFSPSVLQPSHAGLQPHTGPSIAPPSYFGANQTYQHSNLAMRRATVGPISLNLTAPNNRYPTTPSPGQLHRLTIPPTSAPSTAPRSPVGSSTPSPTARRTAGRGSRKSAGGGAAMFINFTSKDANKLLSGVAPSGSSKRKREEEEAKAAGVKLARTDGSATPSGSGSPVA